MTAASKTSITLPASPAATGWEVLVYAHTHWDREWYQPFERFRMQLVGAVDSVIDALESDPAFTSFTLDGQTIVLDDYLQVRPEERERLTALIRAGRIEVGPWYVLPDEFLVTGESLVRNLLEGRRGAERFTGAMPVGYLPDPFGHVAQMPQILRGFGIETAIFSRGMGDEFTRLGSEFDWAAPDGSTVVAIVQTSPYTNGYCNAELLSQRHAEDDTEDALQVGGELAQHLAQSARTPVLLFAAGCDHETINPALPQLVGELETRLENASVRLTGLRDVADAVLAAAITARAEGRFTTYTGELRGSRHAPILAGIFSARIPLKQDNARLQTLLKRYVEPFVAIAEFRGLHRSQPGLERHAWRLAMQNQPHDSIGGCSVDSTHREMPVRTKRATEVGMGMLQELVAALGGGDETVVLNPHRFVASGLVRTADGDELFVGPLPPLSASPLTRVAGVASGTHVEEPRTIASDLVRVRAGVDGSIRIAMLGPDGAETAVVDDALRFVDQADAGDEYDFGAVAGDRPVTSELSGLRAWQLECGAARLELTHTLSLPVALKPDRRGRTAERAEHTLHTTITVVDGQSWAECRTRWTSSVTDHRLRLQVRLPQPATDSHADGHFHFATRPARPAAPETDWKQQPASSQYAEHLVTASHRDHPDGSHVVVMGEGLHEYELTQMDADGQAALLELTLLRGVGWLSRDDIPGRPGHAGPAVATPEAQGLGEHEVRYGIAAYEGPWQPIRAAERAEQFAAPPLVVEPVAEAIRWESGNRARVRDLRYATRSGAALDQLADNGIEVTGAQLSTIKRSEDGAGDIVIRVWNPGPESVAATVLVPGSDGILRIRLDESPAADAPLEVDADGRVAFDVIPGQIVTLRARRCATAAG